MTTVTATPTIERDEVIDLTSFEVETTALLREFRSFVSTGDCNVCFAPIRHDGCLCTRAGEIKVEIISDALRRIKRVVQQKTHWLVRFGIAVVVAIAAIVALMPSSDPAEAGMPDRMEGVRSALTSNAAAQRAIHDATGSYTASLPELQKHGAPASADVKVRVAFADQSGFCIEAGTFGNDTTWRYSSYRATPEPGTC